ncbi:hydantoinase B/oxoprolinase family protein [Thermogymnomonas acidicola]|nr:hydantoinase B/oxoprolinase family protein [Thermogymnomonas acidicola]
MFQTTMRSARSTVIYDVLDYSNAITDSGGETWLPYHAAYRCSPACSTSW